MQTIHHSNLNHSYTLASQTILVVFTGGTIGSTVSDGVINTSGQAGFKLIQLFQSLPQSEAVNFDCIQPLQILSENLYPQIWTTLIQAIEDKLNSRFYDGVIVTHGTDTLAFTAAALSLYFHDLDKPLLLVSSNYPLEYPQANGLQNFRCAMRFIQQQKQNGVFVAYTNPGQNTEIHLGSRLASCLPLSGDFISVQSKSYLTFVDDDFIGSPDLPGFKAREGLNLKPNFSKRILLIKPYPGLDYSAFNLTGVDAVLHDLYHSGTACTVADWGENHNLLAFVQRCRIEGVRCYLAPALKTADLYASSCELLNQGVKVIWNMSLETAYVKLLLAYGNFDCDEQIDEFLQTDMAWEHVENSHS